MQVLREDLPAGNRNFPAVAFLPEAPLGAAAVFHGYSGCKEELLGLGARIARSGLATYVADLAGHGENQSNFDEAVLDDARALTSWLSRFGKVVAIGHSFGGRVASLCGTDFFIGLSPGLVAQYQTQTHEKRNFLRHYRVRGGSHQALFRLLSSLPVREFSPADAESTLILCGSRDLPDVLAPCRDVAERGVPLVLVEHALHGDIFTHPETFRILGETLARWFPGPASE
jgi:dienelactone hydrolase